MAEPLLLRKASRQRRRHHPSAFTGVQCELASYLRGMTNPWIKF
jgi:hypothetical protein